MKTGIGRKIINARRDADMNQEMLAQKLGISRTSIVNWENDRFEPTEENLQKLSTILKKPLSYFGETEENIINQNIEPYKVYSLTANIISIPVLTTPLPGGLPMYTDKDIVSYELLPRSVFYGADFIIRCTDKSMSPEIPAGSLCVVRKEVNPLNDKIMLVKTYEGYIIKRISITSKGIELHPTNKHHSIIKPHEFTIIGEIIGICKRF